VNNSEGTVHSVAIDSLLNFEAVKCFGKYQHECSRYENSLIQYFSEISRAQFFTIYITAGQALLSCLTVGAIMWLTIRNALEGELTVGDVVAINAYLMRIWTPLAKLSKFWRTIARNFTNLEALFDLMNTPRFVLDDLNAQPLDLMRGEISFENVYFTYNAQPDPRETQIDFSVEDRLLLEEPVELAEENLVLKGVSFRIKPGQMVAIVGPSGSGKSTISRMICRYYDPTKGRILIDGQDIKTVQQESLRKVIGVVPQDTILFNDSIKYNISYGDLGTPDSADVTHAVMKSQLSGFVTESAEGLETSVGERGIRLSGGERQRIAIGRVILKNPSILILDEATSSLDSATEKSILQALAEVSKGRTTMVIAHRLSTIVDADLIIVLKYGVVVEQGNHAKLLEKNGEYASMWATQNKPNPQPGND